MLRKIITKLINKGFIKINKLPAEALVLFIKKLGGGLKFCVDYRALNVITQKNKYLIPLIWETLSLIYKAKWLIKFNIFTAFYKIQVAKKRNKRRPSVYITAYTSG